MQIEVENKTETNVLKKNFVRHTLYATKPDGYKTLFVFRQSIIENN
jgi:hypothetical protein